jgi:hypothetical protein
MRLVRDMLGRALTAIVLARLLPLILSAAISVTVCFPNTAKSQDLKFPQIIKIRYEAIDPHRGGQFVVWVEREKIFYGLDPKMPAARVVDVTYITPSPGSTTIILITVIGVNSTSPDYFHLSGNTRFKISGMKIASSNLP